MRARPTRTVLAALALTLALPAAAHAAGAPGCAVLEDRATGRAAAPAGPVDLEPTGFGTAMLHDTDGLLLAVDGGRVTRTPHAGPAAEWFLGADTLRSTATGRYLAADPATGALTTTTDARPTLRLRPATGCRPFPDAEVGATGTPRRARRGRPLDGIADVHMHLVADLRAGGRVIHGKAFDRFGIARALGGDEHDHGPDGVLDVTGNLLRDGVPVGTHDTQGWPSFTGWPTHDTNTHQQVYHRWLQRAWMGGLRLVVAQVVEDEPLCRIEPLRSHTCDEMATVELAVHRLRALQDHVDAQAGGRGKGWLRLVRDPRQARRVIERGKLAVVVGVESSNPFGCSLLRGIPRCDRDDVDRGVRRLHDLGVRSLFVAHWVDNALAGAALEGGDKGVFISALQVVQTGGFFRTGRCPHPEQGEEVVPAGPEALSPLLVGLSDLSPEPLPLRPAGRQCNTLGLSALGRYAVQRLMDAHMLIEVDHLGEWARERVLALAEARGYPLVSSHTGTGGTWTTGELRRLAAIGGFATATIDDATTLPGKVLRLRERLGGKDARLGLATDTGGFATQPAPDPEARLLDYPFRSLDGRVTFDRQRSGTRVFDLNRDGLAHYGLLPDLLAQARGERDGRAAVAVLRRSAEAYLRTWTRTGA